MRSRARASASAARVPCTRAPWRRSRSTIRPWIAFGTPSPPDGPDPILLAQLTDLHLTVGPDDHGAASALERAVAEVAGLDPPPDAVLLTGDLVDGGDP